MAMRDIGSGNNPTIKDFVLQQAHQRAFQISVIALKDYEKQRTRIIQDRKEGQHVQFEKKHKQAEAAVRIHKSALINGSRMKKMNARHTDLMQVVSGSELLLKEKIIKNPSQYKNLIKKLILQGLIKMLQPVVLVRCLRRDRDIVLSVLEEAKNQFKNLIKKQGIDENVGNVDLRLEQKFYLEQRNIAQGVDDKISKGDENTKCFGGVILTSEDGLIVCKNTLDARIDLAYQHMLPTIRRTLFN